MTLGSLGQLACYCFYLSFQANWLSVTHYAAIDQHTSVCFKHLIILKGKKQPSVFFLITWTTTLSKWGNMIYFCISNNLIIFYSHYWDGCQTSTSGQTCLRFQMQPACLWSTFHLKHGARKCRWLPVRPNLCGAESQPPSPPFQYAVCDTFRPPSQSDGRREWLLFYKFGRLQAKQSQDTLPDV